MFGNTSIPVLEQVVQFTQARHGVLAGNLANMDTPGYKSADLSPQRFQEKLKEAIENRGTESRAAREQRYANTTANGESLFTSNEDPFSEVRDSMHSILYHDQSNVSLEKQVTEMSKNQMMHNTAMTLLASRLRLMQTAITERVA